jgi:hypothetical protein
LTRITVRVRTLPEQAEAPVHPVAGAATVPAHAETAAHEDSRLRKPASEFEAMAKIAINAKTQRNRKIMAKLL